MSIRCRLRLHAWTNPVQVRDDSMVTATGGFGVIAAYRYRYTCRRCGQDSDEFYGYRTTLEPVDPSPAAPESPADQAGTTGTENHTNGSHDA